jgi:hypothetical protein
LLNSAFEERLKKKPRVLQINASARSEQNANYKGKSCRGSFCNAGARVSQAVQAWVFTHSAAEGFMQLKSRQAAKFIDDMVALELIELIMPVRDTL